MQELRGGLRDSPERCNLSTPGRPQTPTPERHVLPEHRQNWMHQQTPPQAQLQTQQQAQFHVQQYGDVPLWQPAAQMPPGAGAAPQGAAGPAAGAPTAARFRAGLQALVGMGFAEAASRSALDAARGDVDAAVELLLAGQ